MAVRIEKLLKRYLDELNDETLREFQWQASLDVKIPRRKLHNVTREDTVDCLVQVHGEDEAASTTVNIFLDMNQNNLAKKLSQALENRKTEQPMVSTVRPRQRDEPPVVPNDLCCSISLLLFNDPVPPQCDHSFCKGLREWRGTHECPLCQKAPSLSVSQKQEASEKDQQFSDPFVESIKTQSHNRASVVPLEKEKTNKACILEMVAEKKRGIDSYANTLEIIEDMDDESAQHIQMLLEREKLEHRVCRKLLGAIEDMMPLV
ncbi:uncharacterized protein V6R79_023031 [Siganus canaliculatus]